PGLLQRVLQCQRVVAGCEHAHVVGARAIHALGAAGDSAEDVAAADHHRGLHPALDEVTDLGGEARQRRRVDPVARVAHERLPRQLEEDAAVPRLLRGGRLGGVHARALLAPRVAADNHRRCPTSAATTKAPPRRHPVRDRARPDDGASRPARSPRSPEPPRPPERTGEAPSTARCGAGPQTDIDLATSAAKSSLFFSMPSPTSKRTKRRTAIFSPILAPVSLTSSPTRFLSSFTQNWSTRQTVSKYLSIFPWTIFSRMFSGFF